MPFLDNSMPSCEHSVQDFLHIPSPFLFSEDHHSPLLTNPAGERFLHVFGLSEAEQVLVAFTPLPPHDKTLRELVEWTRVTGRSSLVRCVCADLPSFEFVDWLLFPCSADHPPRIALQPVNYPGFRNSSEQASLTNEILVQERTAELQELNAFLRAIVDSSTETFIIAVGPGGTILSFNVGATHAFQFESTEVVGRMPASALLFRDAINQPDWDHLIEDALQVETKREVVELRRKDGSTFPAMVDITPLRNSERRELGILLVGRDITETITTQHALEERKNELEFLNLLALDISQTLQLDEVATTTVKLVQSTFDGVAGAFFRHALGQGELLLQCSDVRPGELVDEQVLKPSVEDFILLQDGELCIRSIELPVPNGQGTRRMRKFMLPLIPKAVLIGVVVIITPRNIQRSEEFLRFASAMGGTIGAAIENAMLYNESLSKSNEIKKQNRELDEFAYIVSHDLKEPLAGISFISNLLLDDYSSKLDDLGQQYIFSLIDFSKRLGALIDALLDLSRIGRISNPPERVDMADIMHDVVENLSFQLRNTNTSLRIQEGMPCLYGDKTRISQVFYNLVSNAMKFNDKDERIVEISWDDDGEDSCLFHVRDNGIGIERAYFEKIFLIFERLNPREEYEGNGAGLTIIKKIIENHGGRIWLESTLDVGTTFHFTLPKFCPS